VHSHPAADRIALIDGDAPLPFADESFDLVVSDNTFEHIARPDVVSRELLRVLRPGGFICARTPNKYGYVATAARLLPDRLDGFVLSKAQPGRDNQDKFPIHYRLNEPRSLRRHFALGSVNIKYPDVEPSYYFGSGTIKAAMSLLHAVTPARLRPVMIVLVRKG
jgi:SAM-dependent methyltransferase